MLGKTQIFLVALCMFAHAHALETERSFESDVGDIVKATFLGMEDGKAILLRADGQTFAVHLHELCKEDQSYITTTAARLKEQTSILNGAAGRKISTGKAFSSLNAAELASALKLRPESTSKHGKSWRLYAAFAKNYTLFGAMPYSVALYSDDEGKVENVSIVYANKGDFGSTAGFAQDHFKSIGSKPPGSLEEAMALDEKTITNALTSVFGEGKSQRYGESKTRRSITRWDWNGHSFLLSTEENEYVSLSIVSTDMADSGGKSARMTDAALKQRLISNVNHSENGDVFITEIPMVDQGPKGYCVPATFERAMRTMGIEADMYLLAMVGQSSSGGGTVVEVLLDNVKSAVYRKGRRTKEEQIRSLKIRDVKRYIDQGAPLMWTMHSMESYNEITDENTAGRAKGGAAFREAITTKALKLAEKDKPKDNRHVCMIIGYNEATNEIAVSDSWGKRFELRWVPLEVADWVSSGKLFMILP